MFICPDIDQTATYGLFCILSVFFFHFTEQIQEPSSYGECGKKAPFMRKRLYIVSSFVVSAQRAEINSSEKPRFLARLSTLSIQTDESPMARIV